MSGPSSLTASLTTGESNDNDDGLGDSMVDLLRETLDHIQHNKERSQHTTNELDRVRKQFSSFQDRYSDEKQSWILKEKDYELLIEKLSNELVQCTEENNELVKQLNINQVRIKQVEQAVHQKVLLQSGLDDRYSQLQKQHNQLQSDYMDLRQVYTHVMQKHESVLSNLNKSEEEHQKLLLENEEYSHRLRYLDQKLREQQKKNLEQNTPEMMAIGVQTDPVRMMMKMVVEKEEEEDKDDHERYVNHEQQPRQQQHHQHSQSNSVDMDYFADELQKNRQEKWQNKFDNLHLERQNLKQHSQMIQSKIIRQPKVSLMGNTSQSSKNNEHYSKSPSSKKTEMIASIKVDQKYKRNMIIHAVKNAHQTSLQIKMDYNMICSEIGKELKELSQYFKKTSMICLGMGHKIYVERSHHQIKHDWKQTKDHIECELGIMSNIIQNFMVSVSKEMSEMKRKNLISEMKRYQSDAVYITRVDSSNNNKYNMSPPDKKSGVNKNENNTNMDGVMVYTHELNEIEKQVMNMSEEYNQQTSKLKSKKQKSIPYLVNQFIHEYNGLNKIPDLIDHFKHEPLYSRKNRFRFGTKYIEIVNDHQNGLMVLTSSNINVHHHHHHRGQSTESSMIKKPAMKLQDFVDRHGPTELQKIMRFRK